MDPVGTLYSIPATFLNGLILGMPNSGCRAVFFQGNKLPPLLHTSIVAIIHKEAVYFYTNPSAARSARCVRSSKSSSSEPGSPATDIWGVLNLENDLSQSIYIHNYIRILFLHIYIHTNINKFLCIYTSDISIHMRITCVHMCVYILCVGGSVFIHLYMCVCICIYKCIRYT